MILHHVTTRARTTVPITLPFASHGSSHLEFHGGVLLILGGAPTLVVQVVRRGGMDKRGLLRLALAVLARQVHCQGQEPRSQEAGHTSDYQVDQTEPWRRRSSSEKGGLPIAFLRQRQLLEGSEHGKRKERGWGGCHQGLLSQDSPRVESDNGKTGDR